MTHIELSDRDIEMIVVALEVTAESLRKGHFEVRKSEVTAADMDALAQRLRSDKVGA